MSDSQRYQVVLPGPVAAQLEELAQAADERPSTLAAQLVRSGLERAASGGKVRPRRQAPVVVRQAPAAERAHWLEPWGGDANWRAEMWGQIVALHGRYPRALASLKQGWWEDEQHLETLCALACWRAQLDDAGVDAQEELAFQGQLLHYSALLRQEGGGIARAWKPGAPPDDWTAPRYV
ncbi:MAG: hypothetical protein ACHQHO_06555 [Solirubrobacterales bacterium]